MNTIDIIVSILGSTVRLSVPLLLAALAGLYSERAGIFNIGLEGMMLAGAFGAACIAYITGNPWLGALAGILVAVALNLLHGFASITNRGNQVISGVAINFLASGLTAVLGNAWFNQGGRTPQLTGEARFSPIVLPGAERISGVPLIGPIYANVLSGNNIITYLAFACVPLSWWVLYKTRFGLRLRAVGESPSAVDVAGISVSWLRFRALIVCGVLVGLAGAYLSIAQSASFGRDMSAGKGYIALAALIFAKWKPVPVMFACLLFGFMDAFSNFMQGKSIPLIGEVPVQIFQALPYILTCVLLAGFIGVAQAPKAGGVPYTKER